MAVNISSQSAQQGLKALFVTAVALAGYGTLMASDLLLVAYFCLVAASLLPSFLWLRSGAKGVPILPAFALAHLPYYAFPVVRQETLLNNFDEEEVLIAAATVSLFLLAASAAAYIGARRQGVHPASSAAAQSPAQLSVLILSGLSTGLLFQLGTTTGALFWLGSLYGVARAIALTFALVACYCFGVGSGQHLLKKRNILLAALLLAGNVLASWSSLFLVGGVMYLAACTLGYVIGTGRVPWKSLLLVFATVSVLQAGKSDMRDVNWYQGTNYGDSTGLSEIPGRFMEWAVRGLEVIALREQSLIDEEDIARQTILDRTSLIQIMLRAQRMAPDAVEFLEGETYALLPRILLPRFISPDKPPSQAGMNLLNVHFGLLLEHEVQKTAVGWGLASEAYANFGYLGVVGMGLLVGLIARTLTQRSAVSSGIALPTLLAISVLINMINMEADFTGLALSALQSAVAVLVFYNVLSLLTRRELRKRSVGVPAMPGMGHK